MSSDSQPCAPVCHVNSLVVSRALRDGTEAAGWKHEAAGSEAGYKPDYWARVLSCERGLTLDRLGRLPAEVQREFVLRWAQALGLRVERRDGTNERAAVTALADGARALAEWARVVAEGLK